jgi:hypothetical protein
MSEDNINVKEFDELCADIIALKAKKDDIERDVSEISAELEEKKDKLLSYFEHYEKEKYYANGFTFYTQTRFPVSLPHDLDSKRAFLDYLKERGIYDELVSVNSQTLNSFYKKEMDKAIEEGNVDFKVPGIAEPKAFKKIMFRKS